jgi:hypothetical protein
MAYDFEDETCRFVDGQQVDPPSNASFCVLHEKKA